MNAPKRLIRFARANRSNLTVAEGLGKFRFFKAEQVLPVLRKILVKGLDITHIGDQASARGRVKIDAIANINVLEAMTQIDEV